MNQQPDKFFRDKLENFQPSVPASAWERIAATQDKKKPYKGWLKYAASLLLLAGAGTIWFLSNTPLTPPVTAVVESQPPAPEVPRPSVQSEADPAPAIEPAKTDAVKSDHTNTSRESTPETQVAPLLAHTKSRRREAASKTALADQSRTAGDSNGTDIRIVDRLDTQAERVPAPQEIVETTATIHARPHAAPAATQRVTLTYTTNDVSAYLDKNLADEATDDDKKQSTLKKLLQKANDLKTNQDPFGELRQRKNEILALNFRNDKRGQKTRN